MQVMLLSLFITSLFFALCHIVNGAYIPGCGRSNDYCLIPCNSETLTCPSNTIKHEDARATLAKCFCKRPYTKEEKEQINAQRCVKYTNLCINDWRPSSCKKAKSVCKFKRFQEMCILAKQKKKRYAYEACGIPISPEEKEQETKKSPKKTKKLNE